MRMECEDWRGPIMSARMEKKARKAGKKIARRVIGSALHETFWTRMKIALKILAGR